MIPPVILAICKVNQAFASNSRKISRVDRRAETRLSGASLIGGALGAILEKWAKHLLHSPRRWIVALALLVAVAAVSITQIRLEDGMRQIFQSDHPAFEQFEAFAKRVAQPDADLIVLAEADEPFTGEQLADLRDFALDGQLVEGIALGTSPFSAQQIDPQSGELRSVVDDATNLREEPSALMEQLRQNSFADIPTIDAEHRRMVFLFAMAGGEHTLETSEPVIAEFDALIAGVEEASGVEMTLTGLSPMRHTIISNLAREHLILNLLGGAIGTLISLILFRNLWVGALNGIAPSFALFLTLGFYGLFGISINAITNSVTVLILVLAMADAIHMTYELRRKLGDGVEIEPALKQMLAEVGPPCVLTSLTTAIAFTSLFLSQSSLIHSFAFAGLTGLAASLIALLVIHPLVFLMAWRLQFVRNAFLNSAPREWGYVGWIERVGQFLTRRSLAVTLASIAAFGALIWQTFPLETDHRFGEYLRDDEPSVVALETIEQFSAPTLGMQVELQSVGTDGDLFAPETLAELSQIHRTVEEQFPAHPIISIHNLRETLAAQGQPDEPERLRELLALAPERFASSLVLDDQQFVLSVLAKDDHSMAVRALNHRISTTLAQMDLSHLSVGEPQGLLPMAAEMSDSMIRELATSFLIAAAFCCALIGFWFRHWTYAVASILPNLLPILIVASFLMISGMQIQFTSAVALIIAFGVAADDTVHLLQRHYILSKEAPDDAPRELVVPALKHVTPALVTTTLVLAGGVSATLISIMPTAILFGYLAIAIFILALLADLLILPPALKVLERK